MNIVSVISWILDFVNERWIRVNPYLKDGAGKSMIIEHSLDMYQHLTSILLFSLSKLNICMDMSFFFSKSAFGCEIKCLLIYRVTECSNLAEKQSDY